MRYTPYNDNCTTDTRTQSGKSPNASSACKDGRMQPADDCSLGKGGMRTNGFRHRAACRSPRMLMQLPARIRRLLMSFSGKSFAEVT